MELCLVLSVCSVVLGCLSEEEELCVLVGAAIAKPADKSMRTCGKRISVSHYTNFLKEDEIVSRKGGIRVA